VLPPLIDIRRKREEQREKKKKGRLYSDWLADTGHPINVKNVGGI
jgi:hypothetical protein